MQFLKASSVLFSLVGTTLLITTAGSTGANTWVSSVNAQSPLQRMGETAIASKPKGEGHGGQGGQVIESGPYHLELVTGKEANATHIDFYLQNGSNHQAISNAKVTGQVQMPNGTQKSLNFKYDASGKHYTAILPGKASGAYKVTVLSDINGKKVNGRFSFSR
ncbi:hypothetical protein AB3R30_12215 [Leptolyngbyaceae cyanobacterium UHCC 1019]